MKLAWMIGAGIGLAILADSQASAQAPGCGTIAANTPPARVLTILQCSVKDTLREPESARFRRLHVTQFNYVDGRPPGWALCGEMNGRNGYSGMTGWQQFAYTKGEHRLLQSNLMCEGKPVLAGSR